MWSIWCHLSFLFLCPGSYCSEKFSGILLDIPESSIWLSEEKNILYTLSSLSPWRKWKYVSLKWEFLNWRQILSAWWQDINSWGPTVLYHFLHFLILGQSHEWLSHLAVQQEVPVGPVELGDRFFCLFRFPTSCKVWCHPPWSCPWPEIHGILLK